MNANHRKLVHLVCAVIIHALLVNQTTSQSHGDLSDQESPHHLQPTQPQQIDHSSSGGGQMNHHEQLALRPTTQQDTNSHEHDSGNHQHNSQQHHQLSSNQQHDDHHQVLAGRQHEHHQQEQPSSMLAMPMPPISANDDHIHKQKQNLDPRPTPTPSTQQGEPPATLPGDIDAFAPSKSYQPTMRQQQQQQAIGMRVVSTPAPQQQLLTTSKVNSFDNLAMATQQQQQQSQQTQQKNWDRSLYQQSVVHQLIPREQPVVQIASQQQQQQQTLGPQSSQQQQQQPHQAQTRQINSNDNPMPPSLPAYSQQPAPKPTSQQQQQQGAAASSGVPTASATNPNVYSSQQQPHHQQASYPLYYGHNPFIEILKPQSYADDNIVTLNLSHSHIYEIDSDAFVGQRFEQIDLSNNKLGLIHSRSFRIGPTHSKHNPYNPYGNNATNIRHPATRRPPPTNPKSLVIDFSHNPAIVVLSGAFDHIDVPNCLLNFTNSKTELKFGAFKKYFKEHPGHIIVIESIDCCEQEWLLGYKHNFVEGTRCDHDPNLLLAKESQQTIIESCIAYVTRARRSMTMQGPSLIHMVSATPKGHSCNQTDTHYLTYVILGGTAMILTSLSIYIIFYMFSLKAAFVYQSQMQQPSTTGSNHKS